MIDDILTGIIKPGRYIGNEWNVSRKSFDDAQVKFALCFPDLYEVGMSNLGIRILYGILNNLPRVVCERFFSVGRDLEEKLRGQKQEIFSLESRKPLKEFDLIGFSLGHELLYTNVLNVLDLGAVPLQAGLRGKDFPLLIGGGPCVLNPEPLADFFDLFIIGEAEEALVELVSVFGRLKTDFKSGKISKEDLLREFSRLEGVYVPSFYEVKYSGEGKISAFIAKDGAPDKVKKRVVKDLENSYFPVKWLLPYIQIVHDRITLEITRGCPNCCRFCQARQQYYPLRARSPEKVFSLAQETYASSGYEEFALAGLSMSDYPPIFQLAQKMIEYFKPLGVSVSLPSIKPKNLVGGLSALLASVKKTGLTFAPEAGSKRLRGILGKDFSEEDFFRGLEESFQAGYQHVKLYFMIGIPFEEEKDLDALADLATAVSNLRRKTGQPAAGVNLSINALIPKPFTAFQWFGMADREELLRKQERLKTKIYRQKKIKVNFHNLKMSYLEGIFSRGDRKLGEVILLAFLSGCRFDAWEEHLKFEQWEAAFKKAGVDPGFYLRQKSPDEILPWDFLDIGVPKEALVEEFEKTIAPQ